MSLLVSFGRWLNLKQYQFEVTWSLYLLTRGEKFVIYSMLFLLGSLAVIATVLYLPQHITFLISRAWFYWHGEHVDILEVTKEAAHTIASSATAAAKVTETVVREL